MTAMLQTEWGIDALCAQTDVEIFHPVKGGSSEPARKICARCPVQRQCLRWAVETGQADGILGGTTPKERRRLTIDQVDAMAPPVVQDQPIPPGRPIPVTPTVRPRPIPTPRPVPEVPESVAPAAPAPAGFEVFTKPRKTRRATAVCGTTGGYAKHKRLKEPPCDACKAAAAEYQHAWSSRKQQEKQAARVPGSTPRPTPPAPRPPTIVKPAVRVMWLLPATSGSSHPEYAVDDGTGRFTPIHPATAAELVQQGETIYGRHVTDWAPIGDTS